MCQFFTNAPVPVPNLTHDAAHVNRIEVIEVILSPSHRYMQTIRKAPSYKPVDILGVDSDRCFGQLMASEGSLFFVGQIFLSLLRIDQQ